MEDLEACILLSLYSRNCQESRQNRLNSLGEQDRLRQIPASTLEKMKVKTARRSRFKELLVIVERASGESTVYVSAEAELYVVSSTGEAGNGMSSVHRLERR